MKNRAVWQTIGAVALVAILTAVVGWLLWRWSSHRWAERVARVRDGMSEAEVEAVKGEPDEIVQAPFPSLLEPASATCAQLARRVLVFRRGGVWFQAFLNERRTVECTTMTVVSVD